MAKYLVLLLLVASASAGVVKSDQAEAEESTRNPYDSDVFNSWIDSLFEQFSSNENVNQAESTIVLRSVASTVLDSVAGIAMDEAMSDAMQYQCGQKKFSASNTEILDKLSKKNICIKELRDNLEHLLTLSRSDLSVRNQVASKMLCTILPQAVRCMEPVIESLLECTDSAVAGMPIIRQFRESLEQQYCLNDGSNVAALLNKAPQICVGSGVENLLKFSGPSFLRKLFVDNTSYYPCAVTHYLSQASSVLLPLQCDATTLAKSISTFNQKFVNALSCPAAYL